MDIKQLKYFQVIAEEKHITAAAKKLNMSQPPLSQQLKLLENELGCSLFIRTSKSMELTPEGRYLLEKADQILKNHNSILQSFINIKNGVTGSLTIGSICSAATDYLPKILPFFLESHKEVQTQVYEDTTSNILNMIDNESVEIGIVKEPFNFNQYEHYLIASLNIKNQFVTVSRTHWFPPETDHVNLFDLDDAPLILHNTHRSILVQALKSAGLKARVGWTANNIHSMLRWADQDLGIAVMPYSSSFLFKYMNSSQDISVKVLDNPCFYARTSLVWKKNHTLSAAARQFIRFIKSIEESPSHSLPQKQNIN